VKRLSESRHPARGEAFRRKPKEAKDALPSGGRRQRLSFFQKAARGEAFRRTFRNKFIKPPEVKLPEGRSEKSCFLREPLALPSESASPARGEASFRKLHLWREGRPSLPSESGDVGDGGERRKVTRNLLPKGRESG